MLKAPFPKNCIFFGSQNQYATDSNPFSLLFPNLSPLKQHLPLFPFAHKVSIDTFKVIMIGDDAFKGLGRVGQRYFHINAKSRKVIPSGSYACINFLHLSEIVSIYPHGRQNIEDNAFR